MREFAVCVDLGKKRDRAIFMVMRQVPQLTTGDRRFGKPDRILNLYDITFLDQFVRTSYPELVDNLCVLMGHKDLSRSADLLVDGRNVGEAVIDLMLKQGLYPVSIVATAGDRVHRVYEEMGKVFNTTPGKLRGARVLSQINVPKADLVAAGLALAEQGRVAIAKTLPLAADFRKELEHFKRIRDHRTQHVGYAADDDEIHDDKVFTYLMAAWWFTEGGEVDKPEDMELSGGTGQGTADWNPMDYL